MIAGDFRRAVKVIRLLGRDTVEEIVYSRAVSKLRLTNTVIEEGRFSLLEKAQSAAAGLQVRQTWQPQAKPGNRSQPASCMHLHYMTSTVGQPHLSNYCSWKFSCSIFSHLFCLCQLQKESD